MSLYPLRDISKFELYSLAFEDPLTKTYNRNMLNEVRGYFDTNEVIVAMVDIDNLKWLNDHYGHDAGDKRIKQVANQLKEIGEHVFRLGGDEFLLLSTYSIDKPLSEIAGISYGTRAKVCSESLTEAMKIADVRMYEYKKAHKTKAALNEIYESYLRGKGEEDGSKQPIGDADKPPV